MRLLARQVAFENRVFWRNPASAFFTVALPLVMLIVLTAVFDAAATLPIDFDVSTSGYYVIATITFAVHSTCFTNVAMSITVSRDAGMLKRVRVTPLPVATYVLAKVVHSVLVMVGLVAAVMALGAIAYDVDVPTATLLPLAVTVVLGAATLAALGTAVTAIIPNADAAPAVMNAVALPVLFLSGTFVPTDGAPGWLRAVASVFPIRHLIDALFAGYGLDPGASSGWLPGALAVVAAWGILGGAVAVWRFRFTSAH